MLSEQPQLLADEDFDDESAIADLAELIYEGEAGSAGHPRTSIESVAEFFGASL